jgi:8-oxo-dGTP diphosphatase
MLRLGKPMNDLIIENSAKAIIIRDEAVLLVRYEDSTEMGLGTWYSLPGGRQHFGEEIAESLVRECGEELGAQVQPTHLLFVREYIHERHQLAGKGRNQHKVEFMFLCSLLSDISEARESDPDQESIEWVKLDHLSELNIFPTRLRHLQQLMDGDSADIYWGDAY